MTIAAFPATALDNRLFADPLTADHRRELREARDRGRVIRKAARVANFNGWSTALIAAGSAPFSLNSGVGMALTAGIALVAFNEFRGRKQLLNFNPRAAALLGWNQIGFLAMIVVYSLWMLKANLGDTGAFSEELKGYADLDSVLGTTGGFADLYKQIVVYFYLGVIGLSALFQGGTALYYFSRKKHLEAFVAETPAWVRDLESASLTA